MAASSAALCLGALALSAARRAQTFLAPAALFFFLGWLGIIPYLYPALPANHVTNRMDSEVWDISGEALEPPDYKGGYWRFPMNVTHLARDGLSLSATGKIRVSSRVKPLPVLPGQTVRFQSRLYPITSFANPGGFDYARHMRVQGIFGSAYPWKKGKIAVSGKPTTAALLLERFRARAGRVIDRTVHDPARGVLRALILGGRGGIDPETEKAFQRSGAAHILSISGLHIGMVAGSAFFILRFLLSFLPALALTGRHVKLAALLSLAPALWYGAVSGMATPAQRSVIMAAVCVAAFFVERRHDPANSLAAAGLLVLALWPPALLTVSFQLSFLAVAAIVFAVSRIPAHWISGPDRRLVRWLGLPFLISLSAALGIAPVTLSVFHSFSLVGPLANAILVPLTGFLVIPLGLAAAFIAPVSETCAGWLMGPAGFFLYLAVQGARLAASFPWASVMPVWPNTLETLFYYAILCSLLFFRKSRAAKAGLALCLVLVLLDTGYWLHRRYGGKTLRMTVLDTGQSAATLLELPGGKTVLVDGGGFPDPEAMDMGRHVVAPFVFRKKIRTLDLVVLTHPQADHAGGLAYMAENFAIREFWDNGGRSNAAAVQALYTVLEEKRVHREAARAGKETELGGVRIKVLHPDAKTEAKTKGDANARSVILRAVFGRHAFLLPGDATAGAEKSVLRKTNAEELRASVLLAPHHGSKTSSTEAFLSAVRPSLVVVQARAGGRTKIPDPSVMRRYRSAGARVVVTGVAGAVEVETDGALLEVRTARGER
jgi:competence protein ComEC